MSTRAGRGCKVAGRFPSGLTFLCGFLMILSARGWPLLQVLEPRFWPGTGFDCRRTNEAIGRYSIAVNELQPHFGFVRDQFSTVPSPLPGILSRPIPSGPGLCP